MPQHYCLLDILVIIICFIRMSIKAEICKFYEYFENEPDAEILKIIFLCVFKICTYDTVVANQKFLTKW